MAEIWIVLGSMRETQGVGHLEKLLDVIESHVRPPNQFADLFIHE